MGGSGGKKRRLGWSQEFGMIGSCREPFVEETEVIVITAR